MPEWLPGALVGAGVAGLLVWVDAAFHLAGRAVHVAARLVRQTRERSPEARDVPLETFVRLPCHTTRCAHNQRRHDVTESGLVCRRCGHVVSQS